MHDSKFAMRRKWIAVGAPMYAVLCTVLITAPSALERLPSGVVAVLAMVAGPPVLFGLGWRAWPLIAVSLAVFFLCLFLSRRSLRVSPETEWFAFWLALAVLVWLGSPWLGALAYW